VGEIMAKIQNTRKRHKSNGISIFTEEYELLDGSKKRLVQQVADGSIIKRFDKTPLPKKPTDVICPHFLELKWAYGCPFDCAYCYLKGTFRFRDKGTQPAYKDREKIKLHVDAFLDIVHPKEVLNTGEIADSLMSEKRDNPFSKFIIPLFEGQKRHKVLFLTKSNWVENFLEIEKHDQVIMSFSLNAESVVREWEHRTSSVMERIEAAKNVSDAGYETRIRIDPMVPVLDWEAQYKELIDEIFSNFRPERITIGSLRGLQSTINGVKDRKDKSWVDYLSESSNWGKKIASNLRYKMYSTIVDYLKDSYNFRNVALCKETLEMWKKLGMNYKEIRCNCIW